MFFTATENCGSLQKGFPSAELPMQQLGGLPGHLPAEWKTNTVTVLP